MHEKNEKLKICGMPKQTKKATNHPTATFARAYS